MTAEVYRLVEWAGRKMTVVPAKAIGSVADLLLLTGGFLVKSGDRPGLHFGSKAEPFHRHSRLESRRKTNLNLVLPAHPYWQKRSAIGR